MTTHYGPMLWAGFPQITLPSHFYKLIQKQKLGGLVLFKRNLQSWPQIFALIQEIYAQDFPLWLAIDQEGGPVQRLGPALHYPSIPPAFAWRNQPLEVLRALGYAIGQSLALLGISINFAPVLDLYVEEHPIIGSRAWSQNPQTIAKRARAFVQGHQKAKVYCCGKHFPGHGESTEDSHVSLPSLDLDLEHLIHHTWIPFQALRRDLQWMMTAHLEMKAIHPGRAATLSPKVLNLLRQKVGFQGLVVSDDLDMQAIRAHWNWEESICLGLEAGIDVFLVCQSWERIEEIYEILHRCISKSPVLQRRSEKTLNTLYRLKKLQPLPQNLQSIQQWLERFQTWLNIHRP